MWINAPFTKLMPFLQHYLHCKQLNPHNTSACILIPGYLLKSMRPMLGSMRLLKSFSKGTQLFTTPTKSGSRAAMPGAHWPVYAYTDVPVNFMDRAVEGTPLHALHNCTSHATDAVPDDHALMLHDRGVLSPTGSGDRSRHLNLAENVDILGTALKKEISEVRNASRDSGLPVTHILFLCRIAHVAHEISKSHQVVLSFQYRDSDEQYSHFSLFTRMQTSLDSHSSLRKYVQCIQPSCLSTP